MVYKSFPVGPALREKSDGRAGVKRRRSLCLKVFQGALLSSDEVTKAAPAMTCTRISDHRA